MGQGRPAVAGQGRPAVAGQGRPAVAGQGRRAVAHDGRAVDATWICSACNARPGIRAVSHLAAYSTSSGMSGPRTSPTISAMRKFVVFSGFCSAAVNGTSVAIGCFAGLLGSEHYPQGAVDVAADRGRYGHAGR